jgi:Omp85 superfamily domain
LPRLPRYATVVLLLALVGTARAQQQTSFAPTNRDRMLGRLEQESVDDALAGLGLTVDPAPAGKTIGKIHVVNQEVFSRRDWWFQFFNHFHRTTRDYILERELLVKPGQPYDQALVEESTRYLQAPPPLVISGRTLYQPELSSVVVIQPVMSQSGQPGQVDLLVVTRDLWSLRFNTNFEFQESELTLLSTSLSENNLFGWRKYLALGFGFDQGAYNFGPTYFDPNIRGTRMTLYARATFFAGRDSGAYEGNAQTVSLRYPLYSLASRWGGGVDVGHADQVARNFQGTNLRLVDLAATPGVNDMIPYEYRWRRVTVDGNVARSFPGWVTQRVTMGYLVDSRRPSVLPAFPDPALAPAFLAQWAPISERRSEPYARYELFTPRYVVLRDLETFDLRENYRLGPSLALRIAYGLPALGADFPALVLSGTAAWAVSPAGGFARVTASASVRRLESDGRFIDQFGELTAYAASPVLGRLLRVVVMGQLQAVRADTQRTFFDLGGMNGLRGYAIGEFIGTAAAQGHVELRTMAVPVFSQRFGGVLFYDVGNAAGSIEALVAYHDFGLGLRWLIPQLNSSVIRIDWAIATQDSPSGLTRAGLPGRVSAGFQQVF